MDNLFGFTDQDARVSALVRVEKDDWLELGKHVAIPELAGVERDLLRTMAKATADIGGDGATASGEAESNEKRILDGTGRIAPVA